jgi:transposase InsO family protein
MAFILRKPGTPVNSILPTCPPQGAHSKQGSQLHADSQDGEIFYSLKEAKVLIERWRRHYNTVRPHSALGYRPPTPQTIVPHRGDSPSTIDGLRANRRSANTVTRLN